MTVVGVKEERRNVEVISEDETRTLEKQTREEQEGNYGDRENGTPDATNALYTIKGQLPSSSSPPSTRPLARSTSEVLEGHARLLPPHI